MSAEMEVPLALVCRVTGAPRSTIYERRSRGDVRSRPGPKCSVSDSEVTQRIRQVIKESPFCGVNRPGFPGGSKPWKGWRHGRPTKEVPA